MESKEKIPNLEAFPLGGTVTTQDSLDNDIAAIHCCHRHHSMRATTKISPVRYSGMCDL